MFQHFFASQAASLRTGLVPVNTVAPAITGTETEGETLTCSTGTWSNSPTSHTYQWFTATVDGLGDPVMNGSLFTGTPISGATNSTYVLTSDDVDE